MRVPRTVSDVQKSLNDILTALTNGLRPEDNFQCKLIGPISSAAAGVEFTVNHNLGRVPINYIWNANGPGDLYDSRRNNWTSQQMFLKFENGPTTLYLIVF